MAVNALNPYMQGRQMGMNRPYAPIQAGAKVGVDQLMANRQANALTPTRTQGQNTQLVNIDPAKDIRATADANRLDLRAQMNNDAAMDTERFRQETMDARAIRNNEFTEEQNKLNRELERQQLEAQLDNQRIMQEALFKSREELQDDAQDFQMSIEEKRLANSLKLAGVNSKNAIELAQIRGGFQIAATTAELGQRAEEAREKIKIMRAELKQKKESAEADRKAMLQGKVIDQSAATGRTAMQIEMAEKELDWQQKMFEAEQKLASSKLEQQTTDRKEFSKNVGQVADEYAKWKATGLQAMRKDLQESWVKSMGASFAIKNPELFIKGDPPVQIPMRSGRSKTLNQEWVNTLMANLDDGHKQHFYENVEKVVSERDAEFYKLVLNYMGVLSRGGIPFNLSPNALQPQTTPQPTSPAPAGPPPISPNTQKYLK